MRSSTCPLCEAAAETIDDLRVHLHVDHRKSELIEALVADEAERNEPIPA